MLLVAEILGIIALAIVLAVRITRVVKKITGGTK